MTELVCIDVDVVLLGQAAETCHVLDPRNSLELFFEYPVLDLFFLDQVVIGTLDRVAIDLANRIVGIDARSQDPAAREGL